LKRFFGEQQGATAVIFAIAIFPLIIAVGMAIDFGRMHSTRSKLQGAIDAAVLAAASPQIQELPQAQQIKRAKDAFYANCFNGFAANSKHSPSRTMTASLPER